MNVVQLLAEILGAFRCGSCILVIGVQNPIHSILLLIRVFFLGTLLLFFLQREYFARLFLIVYVGAIVVLFLFIIRRLELKRVHVSRRFRDLFSYRHLIFGFFLFEIFLLLSQNFFSLSAYIDYLNVDLNERVKLGRIDVELPSREEFKYREQQKWTDNPIRYKFNLQPIIDYVINHVWTPYTETRSYHDAIYLIHRTDQLHGLGSILYTEYKVSILIASVLLFLARIGALAISLNLSADARIKGRFFINTDASLANELKRQDANIQTRRHPQLVLNSWRTKLV